MHDINSYLKLKIAVKMHVCVHDRDNWEKAQICHLTPYNPWITYSQFGSAAETHHQNRVHG